MERCDVKRKKHRGAKHTVSDDLVIDAVRAVLTAVRAYPTVTEMHAAVRDHLKGKWVSPRRVLMLTRRKFPAAVRPVYKEGKVRRGLPERCPVCEGLMKPVKSRTLDGGIMVEKHRCPFCRYRTGARRVRVARYEFRRSGLK